MRRALLLAVAVGATGAAIAAYAADLFATLDGSTVDTRFSIRGRQKPPSDVVVVGIDSTTFGALNLQWPFPRRVDGAVITRIAAEHPSAIAYDIVFAQPDGLSEFGPTGKQLSTQDELSFLTAINNAGGRTVFSVQETNASGDFPFLGANGGKLLKEVGSHGASTLFPFDPGGFIRKMDYSVNGLDTFAVVTAEVATDRRISRARFGGGSRWIDFAGPAGTIPSVPFEDVYTGKVPPHLFTGKIVVIGAIAPSLQDIHPTSTDSAMPGPEIQANAIETVLRGFPLSSTPGWVNILLVVALGLAIPLVSLRLGPVAATATALALGAVFAIAVQVAFDNGWIVSFIYPLGALVLGAIGSLAVQLVTEAVERLRVRDLFARFVPEDVVDEVLASADGLRLGGVQRHGTVMFTDLRGFTSFAESLTPARVIEVLNRYLSEMSDAILDHGGTLVAYMGDGIMAVFGAPLRQEDHADRALGAAREMLGVRLPRFNQWLIDEGLGGGFRMGIGLNSGNVMSGHVGSERRVEYTAVGDTTNSASRIESLTKGTAYQLLLSDATREALVTPAPDLVFVEETEIRGRVGRVKLWSVPELESAVEPAPVQAAGTAP
ncbi:MAG: CHASE2 domain-containing protein [Solirubrobacteraceae bacterium]